MKTQRLMDNVGEQLLPRVEKNLQGLKIGFSIVTSQKIVKINK
jgi:hypothetical protein